MVSNGLMNALIFVESGGNADAIGDNGKAKGILQIHACVIEDVNRVCKTNYTHDDAFDSDKAKMICESYLTFWGRQYMMNTGEDITDEILARIWNGGPKGYLKSATIPYWNKVKESIDKL